MVLTNQDSVAREVSFVKNGLVSLSTVTADGHQAWTAVRGPRSLLGIEAVEGTKSNCEVRALTEVAVCAAPVVTLKQMLGSRDGAQVLFKLALTELMEQRRDIDFRSGRPESRLARFILSCERHVGAGHSPAFSKVRVAALVGMRPETLSRVLARFSRQGWIDRTNGIRVIDRQALEALTEREG